jgi:V/A-type H+-transporting ATPase subunit A
VVGNYYKRIINVLKQMNYSEFEGDKFNEYENELNTILSERRVA